jgi:hypothetical protein
MPSELRFPGKFTHAAEFGSAVREPPFEKGRYAH